MNIRDFNVKTDLLILEKIAKEYLEPIYGNQNKAISEWKSGEKKVFIAEKDGKIGGFIALKYSQGKDYIKIGTLFVSENYRNQNMGNSLINIAINYTLKMSLSKLLVTVNQNIRSTINLLEKNNFILIASLKDKYKKGENELIYMKEITKND